MAELPVLAWLISEHAGIAGTRNTSKITWSDLMPEAVGAPEAAMRPKRDTIRRGEIIGERVRGEPKSEAEHLIRCPACGAYVDMRDLGQVLEHEGPLPHPKQDQPQQVGRWLPR